jgi:hypothetical protein
LSAATFGHPAHHDLMPTSFESAQLILTLYEQRREETMRKARDFFISFDPRSFEEFMAGIAGPHSGYIRMVIGYWDMAAAFVAHGAIDEKMFQATNGEYVLVYGKIEPFLPQIREAFANPDYGVNLERLALSLPNAREAIDGRVRRIRAMLAARAASQAPA